VIRFRGAVLKGGCEPILQWRGGTELIFWASLIGVPFVVLAITAIIRHSNGLPHTSATDVWGLFVALDATIALDSDAFAKIIPGHDSSVALRVFGVVFIILCAVMWQLCLYKVEPAIMQSHAPSTSPFPYRVWLFAWATLTTVFALHAAIFTGRLLSW
jgi:hypothetical protein